MLSTEDSILTVYTIMLSAEDRISILSAQDTIMLSIIIIGLDK